MTSPREQAIEEIAGPGSMNLIREIIDRYEAARARLDGAKMMPREATEERVERSGKYLDEVCVNGGAHLEHMGDDAWFLSMRRADGSEFCVWWHGRITLTEERPPRAMHDATPKERD